MERAKSNRIPIPEPEDNPPCFVCGSRNPEGMHLQFFREGESVVAECTTPATWSGWGDVLHGGFQSLLLDELCSWAVSVLLGVRSFVTAELTVRFRRPVKVASPLTVRARIVEHDAERALTHGEILDPEGVVMTEATAVIRLLPPERFRELTGSPGEGPARGSAG